MSETEDGKQDDLSRRLGKFSVSSILIADRLPPIEDILGECTILEVENDAFRDVVIYTATNRHFSALDEGKPIPEYACDITRVSPSKFEWSWREIT